MWRRARSSSDKAENKAPGLRIAAMVRLRSLSRNFFDPYRPERHYMRGPGPRWCEKHRNAAASVDAADLAVHSPVMA
jgi:hypothetical protein